ncbi:MAG: SIMPL domain-containing protein [Chlorobium sp.]|nr:SIMPL domain-containing protein [Chlorobium sp.]MCW8816233.1 SIMPL domain-containing protein [Chlorobium sp.]MCW8819617.1 SIMPL domain-containing protein [Ignavibacteriaceae bacterium]
MKEKRIAESFILGALLCAGLIISSYVVSEGFTRFKAFERTVVVKGLSEREVSADIAIWPVTFTVAADDLSFLVATLKDQNDVVVAFLRQKGIAQKEISVSAPSIIDRQATGYGNANSYRYRYAGSSTVNVYTENIEKVRLARGELSDLGAKGVAISGENYQARSEYLYTKLNEVKPAMIEEATSNARAVAEKFAEDSGSRLGKIKRASQGQFSIMDRDSNTPYMKKVRVVSTLEYYLVD